VTEKGKFDMDKELLFNLPEIPVYIITTAVGEEKLVPAANKRPWIILISMGEDSGLPSALKILKKFGMETLSAIGGRTLATALIDGCFIQDLYLTTSMKYGGEPHTPFYTGRKNYEKNL